MGLQWVSVCAASRRDAGFCSLSASFFFSWKRCAVSHTVYSTEGTWRILWKRKLNWARSSGRVGGCNAVLHCASLCCLGKRDPLLCFRRSPLDEAQPKVSCILLNSAPSSPLSPSPSPPPPPPAPAPPPLNDLNTLHHHHGHSPNAKTTLVAHHPSRFLQAQASRRTPRTTSTSNVYEPFDTFDREQRTHDPQAGDYYTTTQPRAMPMALLS